MRGFIFILSALIASCQSAAEYQVLSEEFGICLITNQRTQITRSIVMDVEVAKIIFTDAAELEVVMDPMGVGGYTRFIEDEHITGNVIDSHGITRYLTIHGQGGQDKTTAVLRSTGRLNQGYPDVWIFLIARNPAAYKNYGRIAESLSTCEGIGKPD